MKKSIIFYIICAVFACNSVFAQRVNLTKAAEAYEQFAYVDAIETYERIAAKGFRSQEMLQQLANAYYFRADYQNAARWYKELFNLNAQQAPAYFYRYAQSLKALENYPEADKMMSEFTVLSQKERRAQLSKERKDYLTEITRNSGSYEVKPLSINSPYSDYGAVFYKNRIVFTSARDTGGLSKRKDHWTGESFTNLYEAEITNMGEAINPVRFSANLSSKFHESTPTFTKDGSTIYFTRNNFHNHKRKTNKQQTTLLKIYRASYLNGEWTNIEELPFTSDEYSTAHPILTPSEDFLYFVSDMPGSIGKSDLYRVAINKDGSFGKPENLGDYINTEGKESFPFISQDNVLFFASDGYPGLGGLDMYASKINEDGSFSVPQNLSTPLNSPMDDFSFIMNPTTKHGYVSSNRSNGIGGDDIYLVHELRPLQFSCNQLISGIITDQGNRKTYGRS